MVFVKVDKRAGFKFRNIVSGDNFDNRIKLNLYFNNKWVKNIQDPQTLNMNEIKKHLCWHTLIKLIVTVFPIDMPHIETQLKKNLRIDLTKITQWGVVQFKMLLKPTRFCINIRGGFLNRSIEVYVNFHGLHQFSSQLIGLTKYMTDWLYQI